MVIHDQSTCNTTHHLTSHCIASYHDTMYRRARVGAYSSKKRSKRTKEAAATRIQGVFRKRKALSNIRAAVRSVYEKHYDTESGQYFYFNRITEQPAWHKPYLLGEEDVVFNPWEELQVDLLLYLFAFASLFVYLFVCLCAL